MSEIRHVAFQAVPAERLDGHKLLHYTIDGDRLTLLLDQSEIKRVLCDQLTDLHLDIVGTLIVQAPVIVNGRTPDGGRLITVSRHEFVPPRALPTGRLCWPAPAEGEFVWLIAEGAMTEAMRQAINCFIAEQLATHYWVQY